MSEGRLFHPRHFGKSTGEPIEVKSSPCLLGYGLADKKGLKTTTLQQHKAVTAQLHEMDKLTNEVNQEGSDHRFSFLLEMLQGMQQAKFKIAKSMKVLREAQEPILKPLHEGLNLRTR